MTDPIGSRASLRRALKLQPDGLLGASTAMPSGAVTRRVLATGVLGAAGGLPAAAAAVSRRGARALSGAGSEAPGVVPVPPLSLLLVTADELRLHELSPGVGRVDPTPSFRVALADVEPVQLFKTVVAIKMQAPLADGSTLAIETKRIGANRHNPKVYQLVADLVAAL